MAADDLTNTELLTFLQDKVLVRLASIDTRLATMNGTIAQNVKDIAANTGSINEQRKALKQTSVDIAVLKERDIHQKERLAETSGAVRDALAKVWDNTTKIAALTATVALITKLAELW